MAPALAANLILMNIRKPMSTEYYRISAGELLQLVVDLLQQKKYLYLANR